MHQMTTQQGATRAKGFDIATAFRGYKERRIVRRAQEQRRAILSGVEGSAAALVVAALCLLAAAPAAIGGAGPHVVLDGNQSVVSVQEDAASAQIAVIFTNVPAGTTTLPSLSIGLTGQPSRFTKNPIATGSFGSACNAGDDYVTPSTVQTSRTSPWAGTVRATFGIVICNDDVPETWKKDLVIELVDGTGYHVHSALGTLRTTIRIVDDDFESSDVTVTPNAMTGDPAIRFTWTPPPAGVAYDFAPAYKKATSDTWVAVARDDTTGSAGGMSFTEGLETRRQLRRTTARDLRRKTSGLGPHRGHHLDRAGQAHGSESYGGRQRDQRELERAHRHRRHRRNDNGLRGALASR